MDSDDDLEESVRETTGSLTPKELQVLKERFGIDVSFDAPLAEITRQFDITREKIREIEREALERQKRKQDHDDPDDLP